MNSIEEIYDLLYDDESKYIFENRLLYSFTKKSKFIRNVTSTVPSIRRIYEYLKVNKQKKILFGAGSIGRRLMRTYDDIEFECFCDNNCQGGNYNGLRIINIAELKQCYFNELIIISTVRFHKEVLNQLLRNGFKEENIINIGIEYEKLIQLQYFDLPQLKNKQSQYETFLDGGCYDGATSVNFIRWCGRKYIKNIYACEPDPENQKKCRLLLEANEIDYELIPKGLWKETTQLKFRGGGRGSQISNEGELSVPVLSIDDIKEPITFIKLDIEGAEKEALIGATNTIQQYKPKLAVCIYHKFEDIWVLPRLIHSINPEYVFYLRHYSFNDNETVLYAI